MPINTADDAPTDARADTSPQAFYGAGDVHDDDGQAIEEPFLHADPQGDMAKAADPHTDTATIPAPTRLIRSFAVLAPGITTLLLPADVNRKELHINVNGTPGTLNSDGVAMADANDSFVREDALPQASMFTTDSGTTTLVHSGAVWVHAPTTNANPVTVSVVAVTQ